MSNIENTPDIPNEEPMAVVSETTETIGGFNPSSFKLGEGTYSLVQDYKDGFDYDALQSRYNEVLAKYDYIVGDWGYDQLRLKGFYKDDFKGVSIDSKISMLQDYLYEYCNFGCSYFVVEQTGSFKRKGRSFSKQAPVDSKSKSKNSSDKKKIKDKHPTKKNKNQHKHKNTNKRHFIIKSEENIK